MWKSIGKQMKVLITAERRAQQHQKNLERLKKLRLMDDDFLTKCFEGETACAQLVLRIILKKQDLKVTEVRTQVFVENILNRSVRLDILATDSAGVKYNIEIQRFDKGAGKKRARYNSSMIDANLLEKGSDFEELPETYVIFITENDVMGKGLPVYEVEKFIVQTGERFEDGAHILYVNGAYRDDTPIGKLMYYFSCPTPSEMNYSVLADRTKFFKESEKGVAIMCKILEEVFEEGIEQGIEQGRKQGHEQGVGQGKGDKW